MVNISISSGYTFCVAALFGSQPEWSDSVVFAAEFIAESITNAPTPFNRCSMAHEQANYFQKFNTTSFVLSRVVCFLLLIHHWRENKPGFFFLEKNTQAHYLTTKIRTAFNLHFSSSLHSAEQSVHIWIIIRFLHLISHFFPSCALNLGMILRPLSKQNISWLYSRFTDDCMVKISHCSVYCHFSRLTRDIIISFHLADEAYVT